MANECWNMVAFYGSPEKRATIKELFKDTSALDDPELSIIFTDEELLYNIDWDEQEDVLYYLSKWRPCYQTMQKLADHFELEFCCLFEELGMCLYGAGFYQEGSLTEICLEPSEFDKYRYEEEECLFYFEGMAYEQQSDILETLLERKINVHYPQFMDRLDRLLL